MKRILIAGIGNIFFGDDAFGCEVIRELSRHHLPREVKVVDFGIRSYDLAFELTEGYEATILVDATPLREPPGTIGLIEIDLQEVSQAQATPADGHTSSPVHALQLAQSLGKLSDRLYLVGCEPAALENDNGEMGLSQEVQEAVPRAVTMIESLVSELLYSETKTEPASSRYERHRL